MKTAIVYYSKHHGNTKKVLDALAAHFPLTLIDASAASHAPLEEYDRIGFASGIYYSKFHKSVLEYAQSELPKGKPVFFLYTCGVEKKGYTDAIARAAESRGAKPLGTFGCLGFNTFGPFRLIGGIAKGHPTQEDLSAAIRFYENLPH